MATLNFGATDKKVFTGVTSALKALPNGPGTIIVFVHKTTTGATDFCALTDNGAPGDWFHGVAQANATNLFDDDGQSAAQANVYTDNTTDWVWAAVDWSTGLSTERFHFRNHTTGGTWTNANSAGNNGALRAGPTTPWMRVGYNGDFSAGTKDMALIAVWAGVRFADSDYASWTKTSDLWTHARGQPTFITELTTTTPVDLAGNATYSSGNSTGTTLTGGDPPSWAFDGTGAPPAAIVQPYESALGAMRPVGMYR